MNETRATLELELNPRKRGDRHVKKDENIFVTSWLPFNLYIRSWCMKANTGNVFLRNDNSRCRLKELAFAKKCKLDYISNFPLKYGRNNCPPTSEVSSRVYLRNWWHIPSGPPFVFTKHRQTLFAYARFLVFTSEQILLWLMSTVRRKMSRHQPFRASLVSAVSGCFLHYFNFQNIN